MANGSRESSRREEKKDSVQHTPKELEVVR